MHASYSIATDDRNKCLGGVEEFIQENNIMHLKLNFREQGIFFRPLQHSRFVRKIFSFRFPSVSIIVSMCVRL